MLTVDIDLVPDQNMRAENFVTTIKVCFLEKHLTQCAL